MEYTQVDVSRFLKHEFRVVSEVDAEMFWVNSYQEGRKDAMNSVWKLENKKPEHPKTRYYPAYSKEYFVEKILPLMFTVTH